MKKQVFKGEVISLRIRLSKEIFNQIPRIRERQQWEKGMKTIGWVNHEGEWFILSDGSKFIKVNTIDIWGFSDHILGMKVKEADTLTSESFRARISSLKNSVQQIYLM